MSKAILVTGAAGFIGARFAENCAAQGLRVIGVDSLDHFKTRAKDQGFLKLDSKVERAELFERLKAAEFSDQITSIIHLGACTDTTELDEDYLREINLEYSQKLWTYAYERKLPFFYASSGATYGDGAQGYNDDEGEMHRLKPLNPYGESKRLFDLWVLEQEKRGLTPPAWAGFKFFNVYGFGEHHKEKMASVVFHAYNQIKRGEEVKLFKSHRAGIADGDQRRDFILVDDLIDVLQFARKGGLRRGIYNLGSGKARSFHDLARAVFKALGIPERIRFIDMPVELRDRYQYFTEARMDRLRKAGYGRPFTSLEDGVKIYIDRMGK